MGPLNVLVHIAWDSLYLESSVQWLLFEPIIREFMVRGGMAYVNAPRFRKADYGVKWYEPEQPWDRERHPYTLDGISDALRIYVQKRGMFHVLLTNRHGTLQAFAGEPLAKVFVGSYTILLKRLGYRRNDWLRSAAHAVARADMALVGAQCVKEFYRKLLVEYLQAHEALEAMERLHVLLPYFRRDVAEVVARESRADPLPRIMVPTGWSAHYGTEEAVEALAKLYASGVSFEVLVRGNGSVLPEWCVRMPWMGQAEFFRLLRTCRLVVIDSNTPEMNTIALESLYLKVPCAIREHGWVGELVGPDYPLVYKTEAELMALANAAIAGELPALPWADLTERVMLYDSVDRARRCVDLAEAVIEKLVERLSREMTERYRNIRRVCLLNGADGTKIVPIQGVVSWLRGDGLTSVQNELGTSVILGLDVLALVLAQQGVRIDLDRMEVEF